MNFSSFYEIWNYLEEGGKYCPEQASELYDEISSWFEEIEEHYDYDDNSLALESDCDVYGRADVINIRNVLDWLDILMSPCEDE